MRLLKSILKDLLKENPTSFIATVAAAETGNFQFKNAPTAKKQKLFWYACNW